MPTQLANTILPLVVVLLWQTRPARSIPLWVDKHLRETPPQTTIPQWGIRLSYPIQQVQTLLLLVALL
jgi:hypothetical protein